MIQDPEPYRLPESGDVEYDHEGRETALILVHERGYDRVTYKKHPIVDIEIEVLGDD